MPAVVNGKWDVRYERMIHLLSGRHMEMDSVLNGCVLIGHIL